MIYFIITTSLFTGDSDSIRKEQYRKGILTLYHQIRAHSFEREHYRIIIVENNGFRTTYLDEIAREIDATLYYTNNNRLPTNNKGYKELQDVLDIISFLPILDDDFVVKMTGRYILDETSLFIERYKNRKENIDAILQYGSYMKPSNEKMGDCITGIIGMRCSYIKRIEKPRESECVEWKWAKVTLEIPENRMIQMSKLGIWICPGSNDYFLV